MEPALSPVELALGLALSVAAGGLVGLERERHARARREPSIGGARTFPLLALLGSVLALLARHFGAAVFAAGTLAVAALLALGYAGTRRERARRAEGGAAGDGTGITSEVAALLVLLLGALPFAEAAGLAFAQRLLLAGALATVATGLLALRGPIHGFAEALSEEDVRATVRFALAAVVALPLLPDRALGPYEALNPFRVGVVVTLIAGVGFVGYVAVRLLGARRGIGATAAFGGLVSSTAVALSFSARGRQRPDLARECSLAVVLAATIMLPRLLALVAAVEPALAPPALVPALCMLAVGLAGSLVLWLRAARSEGGDEPAGLHNPFRLREALRLGLVYVVIRVAAAAAWEHFGQGGLLVSAAAAGLADVDAIALSVARMHADGRVESGPAVSAVLVAAVANTLVKAGIAAVLGGRRVGLAVGAVLVPMAAAGALAAWWTA